MATEEARVYIIDDEAEVRESLARLLASAGVPATECASAGEYLLCPQVAGPACILLDVDMPGVTGPELHELLRRRGTSVPIIYLTGRSSISIGVKAMKQGALDFLEKPVDETALLASIEGARVRSDAPCRRRPAQQADRRRPVDRGENGQGAPWPGHGQDAGQVPGRTGPPVRR